MNTDKIYKAVLLKWFNLSSKFALVYLDDIFFELQCKLELKQIAAEGSILELRVVHLDTNNDQLTLAG